MCVARPGGKILKSGLKIYLLFKHVLTQSLSTLSSHTTPYIMYKWFLKPETFTRKIIITWSPPYT
jgi:hypothetical protein